MPLSPYDRVPWDAAFLLILPLFISIITQRAGRVCRLHENFAPLLRLGIVPCLQDIDLVCGCVTGFLLYGPDYVPFMWRLAWQSRFGDEEPGGFKNINRWTYARWAFFVVITLPKYAALMTCSGLDFVLLQMWATVMALAFISIEALRVIPQKSKEEVYTLLEKIRQRKAGQNIEALLHACEKKEGHHSRFAGAEQPLTEKAAAILEKSLRLRTRLQDTSVRYQSDSKSDYESYQKGDDSEPIESIKCFLHDQESCKLLRCQIQTWSVRSIRDAWKEVLPWHLGITWLYFILVAQNPISTWIVKVTGGLEGSWVLNLLEPILYGVSIGGDMFFINLAAAVYVYGFGQQIRLREFRKNRPKLAGFLCLIWNITIFYLLITYYHPFGITPRIRAFQSSLAGWPTLLPAFGLLILALALPLKLLFRVQYVRRKFVPAVSCRKRTAEEAAKLDRGMEWLTIIMWLNAAVTVTILLLYFVVFYDEARTERPKWTQIYGFFGEIVTPFGVEAN